MQPYKPRLEWLKQEGIDLTDEVIIPHLRLLLGCHTVENPFHVNSVVSGGEVSDSGQLLTSMHDVNDVLTPHKHHSQVYHVTVNLLHGFFLHGSWLNLD